MRMLMKVVIPIEDANKAVTSGSAKRILQGTMETLRPEAASSPIPSFRG